MANLTQYPLLAVLVALATGAVSEAVHWDVSLESTHDTLSSAVTVAIADELERQLGLAVDGCLYFLCGVHGWLDAWNGYVVICRAWPWLTIYLFANWNEPIVRNVDVAVAAISHGEVEEVRREGLPNALPILVGGHRWWFVREEHVVLRWVTEG